MSKVSRGGDVFAVSSREAHAALVSSWRNFPAAVSDLYFKTSPSQPALVRFRFLPASGVTFDHVFHSQITVFLW